MKEQNLFIKSRFGEKLEVLARKADRDGKFPAVLLVPGFGMDLHEYNNSFDEISRSLIKKGFLTLQFSFVGCGRSDGDFSKITFRRQAAQVQDMFKYLVERKDVDKTRVGIIAQSCGVPSTILALPLKIKCLLFISGVANPYQSLKTVLEERGVEFTPDKIIKYPRSSGKIDRIGPSLLETDGRI